MHVYMKLGEYFKLSSRSIPDQVQAILFHSFFPYTHFLITISIQIEAEANELLQTSIVLSK